MFVSILVFLSVLLGACAAGGSPTVDVRGIETKTITDTLTVETSASTETPVLSQTPIPTATLLPTATPAPTLSLRPSEWVHLPSERDLVKDPSWACVGGVAVTDDGLTFEAGGDYLTVVNERGTSLEFSGDFGIAATLRVAEGEWGALVLFGALPQGAWWRGIKRLDVSLSGSAAGRSGQVGVVVWDGTRQSPAFSTSFAAQGASGHATIRLRRQGDQLVVIVDDREAGRLEDTWQMFPDGRAYLGANVPPNGKMTIEQIWVEAEKGQESTIQMIDPAGAPVYTLVPSPLRMLADQRRLFVGAAVAPGPLRCEMAYANALAHGFNMLTTENAMKFGPIHPQPERYTFRDADEIVSYAEQHDMQVRGHTLIWHNQLPPWVAEGRWTRDTLLAVMQEHIVTVVGRYQGRVQVWDVVNEAIDDQSKRLRPTIWETTIGADYLDLAFKWAHEADSDALLFYNDYNEEGMNVKSAGVYELVGGMLERGVPIHGVGLQMHLTSTRPPHWADVQKNIARLNALGLQVHITELDVRIPGQPTDAKLAEQAQVYRDALETCLSAERCTAFVTWGFTDRHSWVPGSFEGWGAALPFDELYRPKPAYQALVEALAGP